MTEDNAYSVLDEYAPRRPQRRIFKPWHRVRKHYVRENLWGQDVAWMLQQRADPDRGALTYLGLPGEDLLDLRYIHSEFCAQEGRELRFLGFDTAAAPDSSGQQSFNVSLQEVRQLSNVDQVLSDVISDDIRLLSSDKSLAWQSLEKYESFDVVNIDLCDSFASDEPAMSQSLYAALHRILSRQSRRQKPWVLFLTSRILPEDISEEAWAKLVEVLRENVERCETFGDALGKEFGSWEEVLASGHTFTPGEFSDYAPIAISKWALKLSVQRGQSMEVSGVMGYRVHGGSEDLDLLNIAFRFTPRQQVSPDSTGLSSAVSTPLDYCALATKIPEVIGRTLNVDDILEGEKSTTRRMADRQEGLLLAARYERTAYREFVERDFPGLYAGD